MAESADVVIYEASMINNCSDLVAGVELVFMDTRASHCSRYVCTFQTETQ